MKLSHDKPANNLIREISIIFFLLFLTLIYFTNLVLNKKLFLSGDIYNFFYSQRIYAKKILQSGSFPFWNTDIFSGVPYIADVQNAVFYPLTVLFYLFPAYYAITTTLVIHIFMAGWFLYLLMRHGFFIDRFSSFIGAMIYMFSGFFTMHMGHLNQVMACAWTPLILLIYIKSIERRKISYAVLAGVVLGLQFLAGGIQNSFYLIITLFLLFLYLGFRKYNSTKDKKDFVFPGLYLLGGIIVAFAVSAIQILPTYELTGLSRRADGLSYIEASADSLSPLQFIINFILPNYFGYYGKLKYWGISFPSEMASYIGIMPLALAIYALIKSKNKQYLCFFWFMAIIALIFAMGKYTPIYKLFFEFGFNRFRSPARFVYIFNLSIAVLAGFGVNSLFSQNDHTKELISSSLRRVLILLSLVAASITLYYLINYPLERFSKMSLSIADYKTMWYRDAVIAVISIISVLLIFEESISKSMKKLIIFFVIFFSLLNFTSESEFQNANSSSDVNPVNNEGEIIKFLQNDKSLFRIFRFATPQLIPNSGILYNISDIGGYGGGILPLNRYDNFIEKTRYLENRKFVINFGLLDMLNVKYIISDLNVSFPEYNKVLTEGSTHLYVKTHFIPRAFLVSKAVLIKNDGELLDAMSKENINFQKTIFLEEKPEYQGRVSKEIIRSNFKKIKIYSSNLIEIEVGLAKKGFLFLSDSYYPGWKVSIDEKPGKILKANYNFRGVALNKGIHLIKFVYKSDLFYIGMIITCVTLVIFSIFFLFQPIFFHKPPFEKAAPTG